MQLIALGTSCMMPTKERNHSSFLLFYGAEGILFDCGEGTQRQLRIAGIRPTRITKILISHWHGDHVLGLPGLIQTLGASDYNRTLQVYGPKGTKQFMEHTFKASVFEQRIAIKIEEVSEGVVCRENGFDIIAMPLEHNTPTLGYALLEKSRRRINLTAAKELGIPEGPLLGKLQAGQSITYHGKRIAAEQVTYIVKGRKVAYIADSTPSKNSVELAKDADILICDSTYSSALQEKAEKYMHMTARQAALIANQANVKQLILTHFSNRYKDTHQLEEDARAVFDNTICAYDFMKVKI